MSNKVNLFLLCCACYTFGSLAYITSQQLDGHYLKSLGKYYENEMLQLYGEFFIKMEETMTAEIKERELEILKEMEFPENATFFEHACTKMDCGTWSGWSDCSARPGYYGMTQRTRECGYNDTLCLFEADEARLDTVSGVCDAPGYGMDCPPNYEFVQEYCLRFMDGFTGSMDTLTRNCNSEHPNSYLVNINSPQKAAAVHALLNIKGYSGSIYINGKRSLRRGAYTTTYEQHLNYTYYAKNEPSNGSSELCRVDEGSPRKMWDRDCFNSYHGVCEVSARP